MELKEAGPIKINVEQRTYVAGGTYGTSAYSYSSTEKMFIGKEQKDTIIEWTKSTKKYKSLPSGKKVFFEKSVIFPKRKFKKSFPNNKIVYSAKDADILIMHVKDLVDSWISMYTLIPCKDGVWTYDLSSPNKDVSITERLHGCVFEKEYEPHLVKKWVQINEFVGEGILDVANLNLVSPEKIDVEAFDRIDKMLAGSMTQMGMNILTAYDFKTEHHKIALLLFRNWRMWDRLHPKKVNIELKTMLKKLEGKYNFRSDDKRFIFALVAAHPNDEIVQNAFSTWVKKYAPEVPGKFKLIIEN